MVIVELKGQAKQEEKISKGMILLLKLSQETGQNKPLVEAWFNGYIVKLRYSDLHEKQFFAFF